MLVGFPTGEHSMWADFVLCRHVRGLALYFNNHLVSIKVFYSEDLAII